MMYRILLVALLALFQGHIGGSPKNCSGKTKSDFPPPETPRCDGASATCIFECINNYQNQMLDLEELKCKSQKTIRESYMNEVYHVCDQLKWDCEAKCGEGDPSCEAIYQECKEDLWTTTYQPQAFAVDAIIAEAQHDAAEDFVGCMAGCCQ